MEDRLIWEYSPQQFLVLEPGTLASSFYLPPLLGITPHHEYGNNNFVKALMVQEADVPTIVCVIRDKGRAKKHYFGNGNYLYDLDEEMDGVTMTMIFYQIPLEYVADYHIFAAGNYSQMSDAAKKQIHAFSGARYNAPGANGHLIIDKKLLVLEKSPILRSYLEKMLDTKIDERAELLDRPGADNYWVG